MSNRCVRTLAFASSLAFAVPAFSQPSSVAWAVTSDRSNGQAIAIDLNSRTAIHTVNAGYSPDLVVAPDGLRLYIASTELPANRDVLKVIDPANGATLSTTDNPDRFGRQGFFFVADMTISSDGGHVYLLRRHSARGTPDAFTIADFDTRSSTFHPSASIGSCAGPSLNARYKGRVVVVCGGTNTIYSIPVDAAGDLGTPQSLNLPAPPDHLSNGQAHAHGDIREAVWGPDPYVYLGTTEGDVWKVNSTTGAVTASAANQLPDKAFASVGGALSPDGRLLYLPCEIRGVFDGLTQYLAAFDASTLKLQSVTDTSYRFNALTPSPTGAQLLLSVPGIQSLVPLNVDSLKPTPALALGATPRLLKTQ